MQTTATICLAKRCTEQDSSSCRKLRRAEGCILLISCCKIRFSSIFASEVFELRMRIREWCSKKKQVKSKVKGHLLMTLYQVRGKKEEDHMISRP